MHRWAVWLSIGGGILFLNAIAFLSLGEKSPFFQITALLLMLWTPVTVVFAVNWVRHNTRRFVRYMATGDANKPVTPRSR